MSPARRVSVAIVGTGYISRYHIDGLRVTGEADITTLVGRDHDRTVRRANEIGIAQASTDPGKVFCDPGIDAVVIATPDDTHKPLAIEALAAGKSVLLQKPMAMNSAECRQILDAAAPGEASFTVSYMHRYFPEVRWLRDRIRERAFGRIHSVRMRNATPGAGWAQWLYDPKHVAGGVVMQLGVHGIDLLQHLFGPIATVSAIASTMKPVCRLQDGGEVKMVLEDNAVAVYEMAAGFNATHEMSWTEVAGCDRFRLEVYFEDGTVWLRTERSAAIFACAAANGAADWRAIDIAPEPLGRAHHQHWLDVVRGKAPVDDTGAAGLSSMLVAEQIYRSAAERRMIRISRPDRDTVLP